MLAIETQNLKKDFKEGKETTHALKGIDLKIEKGEIYGLLGPNGAGKSTTIFILSTLLLPTSGKANILGYDVVKEKKQIRNKIGLCMGGSFFYWTMKTFEILEYYGKMYGIKKEERRQTIRELMDDLDMKPFENKMFSDLSTGMRQKIAVAKALINKPEVLFLDEPTTGLDVEVAIDVRKFIRKKVKEHEMTVILTSHHLSEVEEMCKKIAIINEGKIIEEGTIADIRKKMKFPDIVHLYLSDYKKLEFLKKTEGVLSYKISDGLFIETDDGLELTTRLTKILEKQGTNVLEIEIRKASLEEMFLKIIGSTEDEK